MNQVKLGFNVNLLIKEVESFVQFAHYWRFIILPKRQTHGKMIQRPEHRRRCADDPHSLRIIRQIGIKTPQASIQCRNADSLYSTTINRLTFY